MVLVALLSTRHGSFAAAFSSASSSRFLKNSNRAFLQCRGGANTAWGATATGTTKTNKNCETKLFSTTTRTNDEETTTTTTTTKKSDDDDEEKEQAFPAYQELIGRLQRITHLSRAQSVLGYDQQVFMPSNAAAERGAQMAALAEVIHTQKTDPTLLQLIEKAKQEIDIDNGDNGNKNDIADAKRVLELEEKEFVENQRVPADLAAKAASLSSSAYVDWIKAKEAKDYNLFISTLQDCFDTAMAIAKAKQQGNDDDDDTTGTVYNQMLDEFEMGMSQERIDDMFDQVQTALVPLIERVLHSPNPPSTEPLLPAVTEEGVEGEEDVKKKREGFLDIDKQQKLSQTLAQAIGYDIARGRMDVSVHPFTSRLSTQDVRITSRYRTDEWYQGLAATLHEAGHAIYEQNLPSSATSPGGGGGGGGGGALKINEFLSMGTHESQSLFWERHVGLSKPFWDYATPLLKKTFATSSSSASSPSSPFDKYTSEDIYGAVNAVSRQSLIRVEADELSYPLHVILRYKIEQDVIAGRLAVKDISQRWQDDMKEMLKIEQPMSDDKGCLQDVHWSALAFGYFPTYLIGAMAAAQLSYYCHQDIDDMDTYIGNGNFEPIRVWLTNKVHQHGKRYSSLDELFLDQLGEQLNPKYLIDYLTEKYTDLYQLD